ncbi:hypothetical protein CDAR_279021 [Caerostris darwini]|uniref:Uncharacterized protein n=1 Tax=Caerostris darwini TaxID=1538125 RepID=A0AAV4U9D6_9ARAC|nr:hypothetical protein CDAR_279021 [Caerostris darwini]
MKDNILFEEIIEKAALSTAAIAQWLEHWSRKPGVSVFNAETSPKGHQSGKLVPSLTLFFFNPTKDFPVYGSFRQGNFRFGIAYQVMIQQLVINSQLCVIDKI